MNNELFYYLEAIAEGCQDSPDGARQAILENAVDDFNAMNGTCYDSFDAYINYLKASSKKPTPPPVGTIVMAARPFSNVKRGELGVVYENYNRNGFDREGGQGVSILFSNGFYDGFSASDLERFNIQMTGVVEESLASYQFKDVMSLMDDYRKGVFDQQFPQTRFRLAHFQLIKNDFIADEQSQTAAISAVGFNDR
ncbi:hypothetical protein [Endozoicomonas sp. Mp262]|uniref:hypothetical protein n=1 Tax=Endozoicomonas sp. Mp262 TaxID=2919499 RepID=UPI0021D9CE45